VTLPAARSRAALRLRDTSHNVERERDVIVVGAGAAGLSCAAALSASGRHVVVLEARRRPGGRILTLRLGDEAPVEAGAQVVHGEHAATWGPIVAAGLPVEPLPTDDAFAIVAGGRRYEPPDLQRAGIALPWVVEQQLIAGERPADGPPLQRAVSLAWLSQVWCADPARLVPVGMAAIRGGWRAGLRNFVLPGGYDGVVEQLARGLDVRCSTPVDAIEWRGGDATVRAAAGRWRAPAVVVTVPPPAVAAGAPAFTPALPGWKAAACERIAVGDALSVAVRLDAPAAWSGWALAVDDPAGFWRVRTGSRVMLGSFKGPAAAAARARLADPGTLLAPAATAFPWLAAMPGELAAVVDWGEDPCSRGGYCYPNASDAELRTAWARPVEDTLFFAGDAAAERHPATVHGAIESGLRAARDVGAGD
jgi:monoamine oxidase